MTDLLDLGLGVVMGLNLLMLGASRLPVLIRAVAVQGVLLGLMPLGLEYPSGDWRLGAVALATVLSKGLVIPVLLQRALRLARINREVEPLLGFIPSLLLGTVGTLVALVLTHGLPLRDGHAEGLLVPGALSSILTGFILLLGRVKALSQVCGYLVLENGIYLFGLLLLGSTPVLVESGILLDVTVGVFVIGIIVDRIQRAFDSLDTRRLTILRE